METPDTTWTLRSRVLKLITSSFCTKESENFFNQVGLKEGVDSDLYRSVDPLLGDSYCSFPMPHLTE